MPCSCIRRFVSRWCTSVCSSIWSTWRRPWANIFGWIWSEIFRRIKRNSGTVCRSDSVSSRSFDWALSDAFLLDQWLDKCCQLDRAVSDRTSWYFREQFPHHCLNAGQTNLKPCWPSLQSMSLATKIIYWSIWCFQSLLLVLAWTYYIRLGRLVDQVPVSFRNTLRQVHSEILLENRLYKRWIKPKQPSHVNTIANTKNFRLSSSNVAWTMSIRWIETDAGPRSFVFLIVFCSHLMNIEGKLVVLLFSESVLQP